MQDKYKYGREYERAVAAGGVVDRHSADLQRAGADEGIAVFNAFCATSDEPERYAALIRALNDNIDYTRRHAMRRKQKSDEPQPDGGDKE